MEIDKINQNYFSGYEDLSVHELMIKDKSRTETYLAAIEANKESFKGSLNSSTLLNLSQKMLL